MMITDAELAAWDAGTREWLPANHPQRRLLEEVRALREALRDSDYQLNQALSLLERHGAPSPEKETEDGRS